MTESRKREPAARPVGECLEALAEPVGRRCFRTGLEALDERIEGLHGGELTALVGRPKAGLTAFAIGLAVSSAVLGRRRTALVSLGISEARLTRRLLAYTARLPVDSLRTGRLTHQEHRMVQDADELLAGSKLVVLADPSRDARSLDARLEELARAEGGPSLLIVDGLGRCLEDPGLELRQGSAFTALRRLADRGEHATLLTWTLEPPDRSFSCSNIALEDVPALLHQAETLLALDRDPVRFSRAADARLRVLASPHGPAGSIPLSFSPSIARFDAVEDKARWPGLDVRTRDRLEGLARRFDAPHSFDA